MAALVDTNVLLYRFDPRFPEKRAGADTLLRRGIEEDSVVLAHQAITEFVSAVIRPHRDGPPLLDATSALREAEDLMLQFPVVYPDDRVLRAAFRGMALYGLAWYDAHMWAFAEVHGLSPLYSEDFEHKRWYGTVQVVDPFHGNPIPHPAT